MASWENLSVSMLRHEKKTLLPTHLSPFSNLKLLLVWVVGGSTEGRDSHQLHPLFFPCCNHFFYTAQIIIVEKLMVEG